MTPPETPAASGKREPWNHKDAIIAAGLFTLGAIVGGSGLIWLRMLRAAVCHD